MWHNNKNDVLNSSPLIVPLLTTTNLKNYYEVLVGPGFHIVGCDAKNWYANKKKAISSPFSPSLINWSLLFPPERPWERGWGGTRTDTRTCMTTSTYVPDSQYKRSGKIHEDISRLKAMICFLQYVEEEELKLTTISCLYFRLTVLFVCSCMDSLVIHSIMHKTNTETK